MYKQITTTTTTATTTTTTNNNNNICYSAHLRMTVCRARTTGACVLRAHLSNNSNNTNNNNINTNNVTTNNNDYDLILTMTMIIILAMIIIIIIVMRATFHRVVRQAFQRPTSRTFTGNKHNNYTCQVKCRPCS